MKYGVVGTKLICGYGDKKIEYTSANRIIISQGKMDKYIVIIKSEVENSEFNNFMQDNDDFDLTITQVVKNVVDGETEIIETKINNISFCKKFTTFDCGYSDNVTIVLATFNCEYGDINFILENEYNNTIINYNTLNSRIYYTCMSAEIKRISPYSLETSAKIDHLYKMSQNNILITGKTIEENLLKDWYKKESFSTGAVYKLKHLYDDWLQDECFKNKSTIDIPNNIKLNNKKDKENNIKKKIQYKKPIICITTKKEFESSANASKYYKIDTSGIRKCCKGKQKSAGVIILDDGTEFKLTWKYLKD